MLHPALLPILLLILLLIPIPPPILRALRVLSFVRDLVLTSRRTFVFASTPPLRRKIHMYPATVVPCGPADS